jgi:DNA repair protein RadA/Sms
MVSLEDSPRGSTGFGETDRVLGGGLVPGSLVLMVGEPGIGKSTLLLQMAQAHAHNGGKVMYVSGEESDRQVRLRSQRLGLSGEDVFFVAETDLDIVLQQLEATRPALGIIDSIQALYTSGLPSGPGSVAQVRECTLKLMEWAKSRRTPLLIAGHVTKDGTLAGPRVLEHIVDVVLYMEGERMGTYRLLRSVKNRFGSTNEVGVFHMGAHGLEEVADPSRILLSERSEKAVGSTIVPILEGSRPLMVEIQALTSPSLLAAPRRVANGVDHRRLLMLASVLSQRAGMRLGNQDIIVNVVGGISVSEPASDLAVALAIASSYRNVPMGGDTVCLGEIGLSGEVRSVSQVERRIEEASRLSFTRCLVSASSAKALKGKGGIRVEEVANLGQAIQMALPVRRRKAET